MADHSPDELPLPPTVVSGAKTGAGGVLGIGDKVGARYTIVGMLGFGGSLLGRSISLSDTVEPERLEGAAITWDLFPMLGVPPALGRHFVEQDDRPGAEPVLVLSHEVWQRRYQGDAGIIGRSI